MWPCVDSYLNIRHKVIRGVFVHQCSQPSITRLCLNSTAVMNNMIVKNVLCQSQNVLFLCSISKNID